MHQLLNYQNLIQNIKYWEKNKLKQEYFYAKLLKWLWKSQCICSGLSHQTNCEKFIKIKFKFN